MKSITDKKFSGNLGRMVLLWVFLLGFGYCSTTNDATPPTPTFGDVNLDIVGYVESADIAALTTGADMLFVETPDGQIRIDEVRVVVDEIDINASGSDDSVDIDGPFVARLVSAGALVNETFPDINAISLAAGIYDEIRYKIKPIDEDELPDELADDDIVQEWLAGSSFVISGVYIEPAGVDVNENLVQDEVPFVLTTDQEIPLLITSTDGYEVVSGVSNYLYIAFEMGSWFEGALAGLATVTADDLVDGMIVLNDNSEGVPGDVYVQIEEAFKNSGRVGHDADDDEFDDEDIDDHSSSGEDDEEAGGDSGTGEDADTDTDTDVDGDENDDEEEDGEDDEVEV